MPSAFDCHDTASGFDCKIRINTHDVYGAGGPPTTTGFSYQCFYAVGATYYPATRYTTTSTYYKAGQRKPGNYFTHRTMIYGTVPNVAISSASLSLGGVGFLHDRTWDLVVKQTQDCTPFSGNDGWTFTDLGIVGTVIEPWTMAYAHTEPAIGVIQCLDIPLNISGMVAGSPYWVIMSSDRDFNADTNTGSEYMTTDILGGFDPYAKLLLNGAPRP
jgi:hypothetical protein